MKRKKVLALALASTMLAAMMGCGNTSESSNSGVSENEGAADLTSYEDIVLGEDFTDLEATITMFIEQSPGPGLLRIQNDFLHLQGERFEFG